MFIQYDLVQYSDTVITEYLDDSIHHIVEPCLNIDLAFVGTETETEPDQEVQSLIVFGAALNIIGLKLTEAGDDAILIKDGDTTIDTASSSREKGRSYDAMFKRFNQMKKEILINRFSNISLH